MIAILSLIVVLALSFLITRVATVALTHTGLSREVARFQARSALTGSGFTTSESERVVNHPVRRRILMVLMLLGNIGIISAASSLILAFVDQGRNEGLGLKIALLMAGLAALWGIAGSRWIDHRLSLVVERALGRYTSLEVRDFSSLLGLTGEYRIVELLVTPSSWLSDKTLAETGLREEGVIVLAVKREDGLFLGAPKPTARIHPEDTLIAYGHVDALRRLDERSRGVAGNREHVEAVAQQRRRQRRQEAEDARED